MGEFFVNIRLRPIRIGFLVKPYDIRSIRQIMRINTCLWGGLHNPIIPIFRTTPKEWKCDKHEYLTGYEIAKGYIRFFEPDVYVEAEEGLLEKAGLAVLRTKFSTHRPIIDIKHFMTKEYREINEPYFGQGIFDVLKSTYVNERRFQLREERPAIFPKSKNAFAEACIGVYPNGDKLNYLPKGFRDVFKPEEVDSSPTTWRKIYAEGVITPLNFTNKNIERQRYWYHEPIMYVFDPGKSVDLIDLWNLRIEPSPILPVPLEWFHELSSYLGDLIERNFRPLKDNPQGIMHRSTVEISRSISESRAREVLMPTFCKLPQGSWSFKRNRTPIWHAPFNDRISRSKLTVSERRVRLPVTVTLDGETTAQFETLSPDFAKRYSGSHFRWANVIVPHSYSDHEIATVLPYNTFDRSWPNLGLGDRHVIITQEGWVFTQSYKDQEQPLYLLKKDQAFTQWFKKLGINATLSEPGRIGKQVFNSLKGFWGLRLLNDPEMLQFINKLAMSTRRRGIEGDLGIQEEDFTGRAASIQDWESQIKQRNARRPFPELNLSHYTQRNVIRIGIETACRYCGAKNWRGLDEIGYEVKCERCLKNYEFPQAEIKIQNGNWKYRVVGPFAVPDFARGSYSALLTIKALSELKVTPLKDAINFSTALDLVSGEKKCEIDFALWVEDNNNSDTYGDPKLVIGEAKSFGNQVIKEKDISQIKKAAKMLPNSIIVISVLKENFSDTEKVLLKKFVEWARKPFNGDSRHWVILLTGTELFAEHHITNTWKDKGEPFSQFGDYIRMRTLQDISDATLSIYLGLPGYYEWLENYYRKN